MFLCELLFQCAMLLAICYVALTSLTASEIASSVVVIFTVFIILLILVLFSY